MANSTKKAFTFDLDTKALQKHYPNGDWHNAYYEIKNFFAQNSIEHIQGSSYHSKEPITIPHANSIINNMTQKLPWLNHCMKICSISSVPIQHDVTHIFKKESKRLLILQMKEKILKQLKAGKSFSRIEKEIKIGCKFEPKTLSILNKIKKHKDIEEIIKKENEKCR